MTAAILILHVNGRSISVKAAGVASFNELLQTIRGKCPSIDGVNLCLHYEVGSVSNCELKTSEDYETMLALAAMFPLPVIKIHVVTVNDIFGDMESDSTQSARQNRVNVSRRKETLNHFFRQTKPIYRKPANTPHSPTSNQAQNPQAPSTQQATKQTEIHQMYDSPATPTTNTSPYTSTPDQNYQSTFNPQFSNTFDDYIPGIDVDALGSGSQSYTPRHMPTNWETEDFEQDYEQDGDGVNIEDDEHQAQEAVLQQEERERKKQRILENKRSRSEREINGSWYPGIHDGIPITQFNKPQKERELMSRGWLHSIKGVGQTFQGGVVEFRRELSKYASKIGFHYKYSRNDAKYINAYCKMSEAEGCKWFIKGKLEPVSKWFIVHKAEMKHSCKLSIMRNDTARMGAKLLGEILEEKLRGKPDLSAHELKIEFQDTHGFDLPYMKVWRGVEEAKANIFGTYQSSFDQLRWYSEAIKSTNPGSVVLLETEPQTNKFSRIFISFKGSLEAFKHCRPMLFLDGTFLNNRYKGTILAATAKDANQGLLPVAFAVVESENTSNWVWFIKLIAEHVKHDDKILYISDRAGGILAAFNMLYQRPLHFFCLWHLMKNLRERYPIKSYSDVHRNTMCKRLRQIAYAPTIPAFEAALIPFYELGGDKARQFLMEVPYNRWCIAFSPELLRYGELTSNAAESFNGRILVPRALPITFCLDAIRCQLMKWFVERRADAASWKGALTERMEEQWNKFRDLESSWAICVCKTGEEYEVMSNPSTMVNVMNRTCTCWEWQIAGFPCPHAIAVITRHRLGIRDIIDPYYFNETYQKCYSSEIHAVPTTERFNHIDLNRPAKIQPPNLKNPPGRPKTQRYRKKDVPRGPKVTCPRCGEHTHHVWATCGKAMQ